MPLADYPDLSWFIRAVRVLPVVAVAATVGGIIGGFTVFAIDSALTWQPRPDLRANQAAEQQQAPKSVRIVGGAILDPSAGMSVVCAALDANYQYLKGHGSPEGSPTPAYTIAQLHELMGFPEVWAFEKRFAEN